VPETRTGTGKDQHAIRGHYDMPASFEVIKKNQDYFVGLRTSCYRVVKIWLYVLNTQLITD
jgi:hypothetical protein